MVLRPEPTIRASYATSSTQCLLSQRRKKRSSWNATDEDPAAVGDRIRSCQILVISWQRREVHDMKAH